MTGRRGVKMIVAAGLGLAVGLFFGSQLLSFALPLAIYILGLVSLWVIGSALAYFLVFRLICPGLQRYSPGIRLLWIGLCLLAGFIMVVEIPLSVYPKANQIRITATGEKNPASKGSEVLLASIISGRKMPLFSLSHYCRGDWLAREGFLNSIYNQPSELECIVRSDQPVEIKFGLHPWSGMMSMQYEGIKGQPDEIRQDLYSPGGGETKEYLLDVQLTAVEKFLRIILFFADGIAIGFLMLAGAVLAANRLRSEKMVAADRSLAWYLYALPMMVTWTIYLLSFWPGFLSPDSLSQFEQIISGTFTDWHPAFHTLTLWLVTRAGFSLAWVIFLQIILLSSLVGWGFSLVEKGGTPRWATLSGAAFLAISPAIGLMILNPWKDIAYSLSLLLFVLLVLRIFQTTGGWLNNRLAWLALGLAGSLAALYRHNGAPVVAAGLLALFIGYPRRWKPLLAALMLAAMLWLLVKGPLYQALAVNTTNLEENTGSQQEDFGQNLGLAGTAAILINWHIQAGTPFTADELALYQRAVPLTTGFDLQALADNALGLYRLAVNVALRHPATTLEYLLNASSYIFQVLQPPHARLGYVERSIYPNSFGFEPESKLPWLQPVLSSLAAVTEKPAFDWLFWRNAFWMFCLTLTGMVAALRWKRWQVLLVILPLLMNAIPLAVFSGGQIARYILPTLLAGPLLTGYFLMALKPESQ